MPWVYSVSSSTPPNYTWFGLNTSNQNCAAVALPSSGTITQLKVYAAARSSSVSTRLCLWNAGGSILGQSASFTMATGTEEAGGQAWQTKTLSSPVTLSADTYWVGLYRNPSGAHIMGTANATSTGYIKTNTSSWPSVASMSGYTTDDKKPYVGFFYITEPDAPTGIAVSRNSDTSQTITWTNNDSTDEPYTTLYLQRYDNITGAWYAKATLSGSVESYTDTTTVANRQYTYRVRAWNVDGYSSYNTSSAINTTPAAPTNVVATRVSTTVEVTWTNSATNETAVAIARRESTDGGLTWEAWDYTIPDLAANATSYTDTSPYTYGQYAVRTETTTPTLNSAYTWSNEVVTLSAPDAPTGGAPNSSSIDADDANTFSWTHNPTDETSQTKFSIQYRVVGGAYPGTPQVNEEVGTASSYEFTASTFTNGNSYEWQVKTWGEHANASAWSATFTFDAVTKPVTTITDPTALSDYAFSTLEVDWEYTQAESNSQAQYLCKLYDSNDILLETQLVSSIIASGATDTATFTYLLTNSSTYTVTLQVQESSGLWSTEETVDFTTSFAIPPVPTFVLTSDTDGGYVTVDITNPSPAGAEIDAVSNNLYRSIDGGITYTLVETGIPVNTTVIDYLPLISGTTYYYVESVSSTPTINTSTVGNIEFILTGLYFINSGENYEDYIGLKGDVTFSEKINNDTTLRRFEGRIYPLKYQGTSLEQMITISVDLPFTQYDTLKTIIESSNDVYYRDFRGRHFLCVLSDCKFDRKDNGAYQFTCIITRIEGE